MSNMQRGAIKWIGPLEQPTDKFKKREFVIQTDDKFPKEICFQLTQERVDLIDPYQINETIQVHYNLESKKSKDGRYFTTATAWRLEKQHYNQD